MEPEFNVVPATLADIGGIVAVFEENRGDWSLLQRTPESIRNDLDNFLVARTKNSEVVGCAAIHPDSAAMAEVLSVAVRPAWQGKDAGALLMRGCEDLARARSIQRLWLATLKPEYFARFGYRRFSKWQLPAKVLGRKLGLIFTLPAGQWLRELLAPFAFMEKDVGPPAAGVRRQAKPPPL